MTSVLVSFCNNFRRYAEVGNNLTLAIVNIVTGDVRPIYIPDHVALKGCTGIAFHDGAYVAVGQSAPSKLIYLTEDLAYTSDHPLKNTKGVHSLVALGQQLLAVATGSDSIVEIREQSIRTIWRKNDLNLDTIHLNSLTHDNGRLAASAFGPKIDGSWRGAAGGSAFYLDTGETIFESLQQPHSLHYSDNCMLVCDSSRGRFLIGNTPHDFEYGYARGLLVIGTTVLVGSSISRVYSESTGERVPNPSEPGMPVGRCGIAIYQRVDTTQSIVSKGFIDLTGYANELFEIRPFRA